MYQYLGLIVGVQKYHDEKVPPVRFASDDAKEFRQALIDLGGDEERLELVPSEKSTKTTIKQKIKDLASIATETDVLIFYFAGHGYYYEGHNVLACVDSLQRSISDTTISLKWILSQFDSSSCRKVIVFLDCCHSGIKFSETERGVVGEFSVDDLKFYNKAEHLTVFSACKDNEKSQTDLERKHGAWSYYLLNALKGNADEEIYRDGMLTSANLQKYLAENTRRRVKEITSVKTNQTPIMYGKQSSDFIVADLTPIFEAKAAKIKTEGIKLERAVILATEDDWVRNLPGFISAKHKEPKVSDDYHEKWIKQIAAKLIEDELNEVAVQLRDELGYTRKEVTATEVYGGIGELNTPDFDYRVVVTQSKEDSKSYILTRSIDNFTNSDILTNPKFNSVFDRTFNEVEFILKGNLNAEDVIDKVEAVKNKELIRVEYKTTDTSKCTVFVKGFSGSIHVTNRTFKIISNTKASPEGILLSFKNAYEIIEGHKIPKLIL